MTMQITQPAAATRKHWKTPVLQTAATALLVLGLAAGLGLRQAGRHGGPGDTAGALLAAAPSPSAIPAHSTVPAGADVTVYVVSSRAEANALQADIDEAAALLAEVNLPSRVNRVLVWGAGQAETIR